MPRSQYRIMKNRPPVESDIFRTYPVIHQGMLFGAKTAKKEQDDPLLVRHARVQKKLVHPGIVPVFRWEVSEDTGRPFALTRYVENPRLRELENISFEQKIDIASSIADALGYAHSAGHSHGGLDIRQDDSYDNIFAGTGSAMLDNFGIKDADEKADAYYLVKRLWGLVAGTDFTDFSSRKNWWPRRLTVLFREGMSTSAEERPAMPQIGRQLNDIMKEYNAFLLDLSGHSVAFFENSPESLDLARKHILIGNKYEASRLLKISAVYFRNPEAIKMLAGLMIDSGRLDDACGLLVPGIPPEIEKMVLEAALVTNDKIKSRLIRRMKISSVCDAVAAVNPAYYPAIRKKGCNSESAGIAAAINKCPEAVELLSLSTNTEVASNNIGAALAIRNIGEAIGYLKKSKLEQSAVNTALFLIQSGEHRKAFDAATPVRHNPKAAAVMSAVRKKLGIPANEHPDFAMRLLTEKLSERILSRGVMPLDYEFVKTTQII